jgi:hypothetical protein
MRKLYIPVVLILLLTVLSCGQTGKQDSKDLEQQIEVEAYQFEELLTELSQHVSAMAYPQDIPLEPLVPDSWIFKCCDPGTTGTPAKYALCIPVPKGIKTGFTVVKSSDVDYRTYYQRQTFLDPKTDFYVVSSMPSKDRYKDLIFNNPIPDFREYPKRETIDCLKSRMIVISPYYIPENVTHGYYSLRGPEPFNDGGSNYNLVNLAGDMFDANPYKERTAVQEHQDPQLGDVLKQLRAQIDVINVDIDNALNFVDRLEELFFKPNAEIWDTQDELAQYRESMEDIRANLSQIEAYLQEIESWDFSSISYSLNGGPLPGEGAGSTF